MKNQMILFCSLIFFVSLFSNHIYAEDNSARCSAGQLENRDPKCWNEIFREYIDFDTVFTAEVFGLKDHGDSGVLFTAFGQVKNIPKGTVILPEGYSYKGDKTIESYFGAREKHPNSAHISHKGNNLKNYIYGIFVLNPSGKWTLQIFGYIESWECGENKEAELGWVKEEHLCQSMPGDELKAFNAQRLLSNEPFQVVYKFLPGGEASGVYDILFVYKEGIFKPVYFAWHDKYGHQEGEKVRYERDKIVEYTSLHTLFEVGTHYYSSFTAKTIRKWNGKQFVVVEESIDPLELYPGADSESKTKHIYDNQGRFDQGKDRWRANPVEVAKRYCKECRNFRTAFRKKGVAIVWADRQIENFSKRISIYLYQPFYSYKKKGTRSIWEVAGDERASASMFSAFQ